MFLSCQPITMEKHHLPGQWCSCHVYMLPEDRGNDYACRVVERERREEGERGGDRGEGKRPLRVERVYGCTRASRAQVNRPTQATDRLKHSYHIPIPIGVMDTHLTPHVCVLSLEAKLQFKKPSCVCSTLTLILCLRICVVKY